ncbi:MAG: hypothetical protein KGZ71_09895 [Desulfobulbaceae bacterium]|nr:hypothetical protein [Candidatus Kapabacteria bacterium]MBS4000779.1 hypothetical protein [Desulfobulbaceae bacterium]
MINLGVAFKDLITENLADFEFNREVVGDVEIWTDEALNDKQGFGIYFVFQLNEDNQFNGEFAIQFKTPDDSQYSIGWNLSRRIIELMASGADEFSNALQLIDDVGKDFKKFSKKVVQ